MRVYAFQKLPGVPSTYLYNEHWLNGVFHGTGSGTRCYHYEGPDDVLLPWVRTGVAKVIPPGRKFPCATQIAGKPTGKVVY